MGWNSQTAFMNLPPAPNNAPDSTGTSQPGVRGVNRCSRWMSACWRRCGRACRTAPGWPWGWTAWSRSPWARHDWPIPWPSPSTTPDGVSAFGSILAARQILARARIDAQNFALVDEQGHSHHGAGLELRRLGAAGCGIAAHAGIGLDHLELHVRRRSHLQGYAVPQGDDADGAVFQPLGTLAHRLLGGGELLEGIRHHEMKKISVAVQILHIRIDHIGRFHGVA